MKRKGLLHIFGLVIAPGLVSLSTVEAWPSSFATCYYACSESGPYAAYTSYFDCCYGDRSALWCPVGETPMGGNSWSDAYGEEIPC